MATKKEDVIQDVPEVTTDEGAAPLIRSLPEFDVTTYVDGEPTVTHYKMRDLRLNDAFKMLRVISAASTSMARMAAQGAFKDGQGVMYAVLGAIPYAERDVKDLVANTLTYEKAGKVISATVDELERLPLDALVPIIEGIGTHPDLASFLKNVRGLANTPLMTQIQEGMKDSQPTTSPTN